jgi:hypothetical protein
LPRNVCTPYSGQTGGLSKANKQILSFDAKKRLYLAHISCSCSYFSHILNVHRFSDVRQAEIHTAERLVPEPSALEVGLAIEKLKSHKSTETC